MEVKFLGRRGDWRDVADASRTTVGKDPGTGEPSSRWKKNILLAEHSPIRLLHLKWKWTDLLWWVQTHFTRHHIGVEWFVKTSRTDRTGVDRSTLTQNSPINVEGEANTQAIINISRKRLCQKASPETRKAWVEFLKSIKPYEPELYSVCVPECVYRGFCPELESCGWTEKHPEQFIKILEEYRAK